jgi:cell division protein FtsA
MFDSSSIIVGLEIGTSKICVVVGEINAATPSTSSASARPAPAACARARSPTPALAEEDVRNAIVEAEQMANVEIRSVYLGVTGNHIRGFSNHGVHPVVSADREITEEDVQDVIKNAKAINLPVENSVIHAIRQHFQVDAQTGILNPVGMFGAKVEVDVHVVHGHGNRLKNSIAVVKGLQLDVEEIVFNGLASALALLSNEQKELGSLVIDLGGGTTDYAVYCDGIIKHTGVLAVGGDHRFQRPGLRPESPAGPRRTIEIGPRLRRRAAGRQGAHH